MEIKKWLPKFQTCQEEYPTSIINKDLDVIHGGPKFGPLPPLTRDGICIPLQVSSTDFVSEKLSEPYDNPNNHLRTRKFGPGIM